MIAASLFVSGYLALCGLLAWGTVCRKPKTMAPTPAAFGLRGESARFASADGTALRGWLIPAEGKGKAKGLIICCHGVDSARLAMLQPARALHRAHYAVLIFDFRGRGASGGAHSTLGFRETDDLLAAAAWTQSRPDSRALPVKCLARGVPPIVLPDAKISLEFTTGIPFNLLCENLRNLRTDSFPFSLFPFPLFAFLLTFCKSV